MIIQHSIDANRRRPKLLLQTSSCAASRRYTYLTEGYLQLLIPYHLRFLLWCSTFYFASLIFSNTAETRSSAFSLTRLQSFSYTHFTAPSNSRFHRSFAISVRPTGTTLGAGSVTGGSGSTTFDKTSRCCRSSAACVARFLVWRDTVR